MATIILTGLIKKINASEVKGSFEKRTFLLAEEKDSYPSVWQLEAHQAFCNLLDQYKPGDKVECHVDVTGREWQDKAFNTLKCYRINRLEQAATTSNSISEPMEDVPF